MLCWLIINLMWGQFNVEFLELLLQQAGSLRTAFGTPSARPEPATVCLCGRGMIPESHA